jgi:hypothetical protein
MPKRLPFMMDDFRDTEDEAQLDAVVRASATSDSNDGLDELGLQLLAMREALTVAPDAQTQWNHLAAMRRAVPAARPRRAARGVAAVAAATVSVLALTAGLAAANQLPKPAQDQAARLAEIVGVDLPGNDHQSDGSHSTPSTTLPGATTASNGQTTSPGASSGDASSDDPATPGASSAAPGQSGTAPGQSGTAPGQSGVEPGHSGTAPGQSGSTPGQSGTVPDQTGTTPGKSGSAPGQSGTSPGKSGAAPGHNTTTTTTNPDAAPGKSGDAPGHNK